MEHHFQPFLHIPVIYWCQRIKLKSDHNSPVGISLTSRLVLFSVDDENEEILSHLVIKQRHVREKVSRDMFPPMFQLNELKCFSRDTKERREPLHGLFAQPHTGRFESSDRSFGACTESRFLQDELEKEQRLKLQQEHPSTEGSDFIQ